MKIKINLNRSSKKSKSFNGVVYDGEARSQKELIRYVGNNYKNFSYSNSLKKSNLIWFGKALYPSDIETGTQLKGYINRIPGVELFRNKAVQARILNQLYDLFPEEFKFHPRSFVLPRDSNELQTYMKHNSKNYLIGKPSEGSGGSGIVIFKSAKEMSGSTFKDEGVIQQYVMNPLLINKKKWDMRVYVMVHGISPMKAYIATDCGLARFGTEDYNTSKTKNIYSHLTNYSLNKNSEEYVKDVAFDENSSVINTKISLNDVWKLIKKYYPDADIEVDCKQKMKDIVVNVLTAARSTVELGYIETSGK